MNVNGVFEKASKLVEKGWIQGKYQSDEGYYCAVGAVREAVYAITVPSNTAFKSLRDLDALYTQAKIALERYIINEYGCYNSVENWNDESGRTKEDILLAFKELANS